MFNHDPYSIQWNTEIVKASRMTVAELRGAIRDCQETIVIFGLDIGSGKYYDQISVYRAELKRRGY